MRSTIQALPFYINDYAKPVVPITPEHIAIGPGLGSIIAQFMWAVCDEGDGVLLTTVSIRVERAKDHRLIMYGSRTMVESILRLAALIYSIYLSRRLSA